MPQILMLNHAAWVNKSRMDVRIETKRKTGEPLTIQETIGEMPVWNGKPIDQLTGEEYLQYHASM